MRIGYEKVCLKDGFWKDVREKNARVSLMNVYRRFAETGRFDAIRCEKREKPPHIFYDSDVAKWLEAAAYLQRDYPDEEVASIIRGTVRTIVANQLPCGYFNSYYQVYRRDRIFMERTEHELYCAGHLIEAAVALDACGVDGTLLPAMEKYADYIRERFMIRRDTGFTTCGHPEIELALVRLYAHTGKKKYLELAEFFLNERGRREEPIYDWADHAYDQSHLPVRQQREAVGHAVRALYLYCAMADVGRLTGDAELLSACRALFDDIVKHKLYVTGGVGSGWFGERFTLSYDLPNAEAYAETCAGIALILFCERLAHAGNRSAYHAAVERALYNNVLAGESLDGKGFFYVNPLEADAACAAYARSVPGIPFKPLLQRVEVFDCSCCPPNLVRLFAQVGGLIYGEEDGVLCVDQYISSQTDACGMRVCMTSQLPYEGSVGVSVSGEGTIAFRVPVWSTGIACTVNGAQVVPEVRDGYFSLRVAGETAIAIDFMMRPRFVYAHPAVRADSGRKAVEYGPFVLCAESCDNGGRLYDVSIPSLDGAKTVRTAEGVRLEVPALRSAEDGALYRYQPSAKEPCTLTLIPYYAWANRGEGDMQIWFL